MHKKLSKKELEIKIERLEWRWDWFRTTESIYQLREFLREALSFVNFERNEAELELIDKKLGI